MGSEVDDVTKTGRLFQARAAANGKARSPMVTCLLTGTTRAAVEADRSRSAANGVDTLQLIDQVGRRLPL